MPNTLDILNNLNTFLTFSKFLRILNIPSHSLTTDRGTPTTKWQNGGWLVTDDVTRCPWTHKKGLRSTTLSREAGSLESGSSFTLSLHRRGWAGNKTALHMWGLEAKIIKTQNLTVIQCSTTWSRVTNSTQHCAYPPPLIPLLLWRSQSAVVCSPQPTVGWLVTDDVTRCPFLWTHNGHALNHLVSGGRVALNPAHPLVSHSRRVESLSMVDSIAKCRLDIHSDCRPHVVSSAFPTNAVGLMVFTLNSHRRVDFRALFQQSLPCLAWVQTSNRPDAFAFMEAQTPRQAWKRLQAPAKPPQNSRGVPRCVSSSPASKFSAGGCHMPDLSSWRGRPRVRFRHFGVSCPYPKKPLEATLPDLHSVLSWILCHGHVPGNQKQNSARATGTRRNMAHWQTCPGMCTQHTARADKWCQVKCALFKTPGKHEDRPRDSGVLACPKLFPTLAKVLNSSVPGGCRPSGSPTLPLWDSVESVSLGTAITRKTPQTATNCASCPTRTSDTLSKLEL